MGPALTKKECPRKDLIQKKVRWSKEYLIRVTGVVKPLMVKGQCVSVII
jgi:hypothetical protein